MLIVVSLAIGQCQGRVMSKGKVRNQELRERILFHRRMLQGDAQERAQTSLIVAYTLEVGAEFRNGH